MFDKDRISGSMEVLCWEIRQHCGLNEMTRQILIAALLVVSIQFVSVAHGDLLPGVLTNFQDGSVQGWSGGAVFNISNSGPLGTGDHSLQLSNGTITGNNFAMFNQGINGVISPSVSAITSDIFRPSGEGSAEMRLVLFDFSGTRWTSTNAVNVVDDNLWHGFSFSILESALTRVAGTGSYTDLTSGLERIMFRFDAGAPSAGGSSLNGTMNFDNITAIPEPLSALFLANALIFGCSFRRRR